MINTLHPYHRESKAISYKISPTDENTVKNFEEITRRIQTFQDKLQQSQRNAIENFGASDIFIQPEKNIPQKDFLKIYKLNYSKLVMIYEKYLEDSAKSLQEAYEMYRENNEMGDQEISFDSVERPSGGKLIGLASDLRLSFDIEKVSMKDKDVSFEELDSYGVYVMDSEVAEDINKFIGRKQYSEWNFNGATKKLVKQDKSEEVYDEIQNLLEDTKNKKEFFKELSSKYLSSYEAHILYYFIKGYTNSMLFAYSCVHKELIDSIIEEFDINYLNIPQAGQILLSQDEIKINKNYQDMLENKNIEIIPEEEQKKILSYIGVSENTLSKMDSYGDSYYLREIEKVSEMYFQNKLTDKELQSYLWSPHYSDLTENGIYQIVQEGRKRREQNPEIVEDPEKIMYSNKKYIFPLIIPKF